MKGVRTPTPQVPHGTAPIHEHGPPSRARDSALKSSVAQAARTEATTGKFAVAPIHPVPGAKPAKGHGAHPATASTLTLPSGTPAWITQELVAHTLQVWQPRYTQRLSIEDAIDMIRSVARLSDAVASVRQS
jgi:hypothetical protein